MKSVLFSNVAKISFFALISGVLVSGCNDLSVKEAEQVAIDYQGQLFTPAPRELDRIYRRIANADNKRPVHPCKICERKLNATGLNAKIKQLAFKGIATYRRGNAAKGFELMSEAHRLYIDKPDNKTIDDNVVGFLFNVLAQYHEAAGNYALAIKYAQRNESSLDASSWGRKGKLISVKTLLARQFAQLGDIDRAESVLTDAQGAYDTLLVNRPDHRFLPLWEGNMALANATVFQAKGQLEEAEKNYREAIRWYKKPVKKKNMYQRHNEITTRAVFLVKNLIDQGRIAEADSEARSAIKRSLLSFGRNAATTAKAILGLAEVMMVRGRYDDVDKLANITRDIVLKTGSNESSSYYVEATNMLAESKLAQFNHKEALRYYNVNLSAIGHQKITRERFIDGNLSYAMALVHAGDLSKAKQIAKTANIRRRAFLGDDHPQVLETEVILNLIRIKQKTNSKELARVIKLLPQYASEIHERIVKQKEPGVLQVRFAMVMDAYMDTVAAFNRSGKYSQQLFAISQMVHGQKVQRALSANAARAVIRDEKLSRLVRTEQDLSLKIKSAYDALANVRKGGGEKEGKIKQALQEKVELLTKARVSIRDEIAGGFPGYEQLVRPKSAAVKQIQKSLAKDEVLLAFYFTEKQGYVFAIKKSGNLTARILKASRGWVDSSVAKIRKSLDSGAQSLAEIPAYDVATAHALYKALLKPVEPVWRKASSLAIVPNGSLASLPLSALVTKPVKLRSNKKLAFAEYRDVQWLAKTHAINYLPSVMSLKTLRELPAAHSKRQDFVGFGNPIFSASSKKLKPKKGNVHVRGLRKVKKGQLDKVKVTSTKLKDLVGLPETEQEIVEVARSLKVKPEKSVFVGTNANEQLIKNMKLDDRKIIMFATHALLPGDLDGLEQPAIALSSPKISKTKGDGLLTMSEVLGLKLDADWVVLSACNTGAASGKGADAISGLGMAFFYAGSRSLLVTHWPVETNSARALTTGLFESQQSKDFTRTEAMAQTVRKMISKGVYRNNGKAEFSYAHPMFWAPFTLIGDGGHKVL